jgi:CBS domain-containing protein
MHQGVNCVGESQTVAEAAMMMRDLHVGAVPVCGTDDRLKGIVTDRDIAVRCVAEGLDPQTTQAGQLAQGPLVWIDADADIHDALHVMEDNKIRRLPVLDQHQLVGIITEADIVTHRPEQELEEFSFAVYSAPPNS